MKKLDIILFYSVFTSLVVCFWAIIFKLVCPHFVVHVIIISFVISSIMSSMLITNCFIKMDEEQKSIAEYYQEIS